MSVLIKGMEMPTSCRACMFSRTDIRNVDWCVLTEKDLPCDCPIVPVPPHGRLIDADCCNDYFYEHMSDDMMIAAMNAINEMPTIIESEDE